MALGGNFGGGGGGGAVGAVTYQTWGTLPASPSQNDIVHFTNIPLSLHFDNTNWQPLYDSAGLWYFFDLGRLTTAMAAEVAGGQTIPAESSTSLTASVTWAIRQNTVGEINYAGSAGGSLIGWDLPAARGRILWLMNFHSGDQGQAEIFIQETAVTGTEMDNAYSHALSSGLSSAVRRESAGITTLIESEEFQVSANSENVAEGYGMALWYDDTTDDLRTYMRIGNTWIETNQVTDSTFTTFATVGIRSPGGINTFARPCAPVLCFAEA